jgi:ribosomal protein S27E
VVALALGAPTPSTEVRVPGPCPDCGESDVLAVGFAEGEMTLECPNCGATVPTGE